MATETVGNLLTERFAALKQKQVITTGVASIIQPLEKIEIIIRPTASSWETLEQKLRQVINLDGVWSTVRELYDQGYSAELETTADFVLDIDTNKPPCHMFTKMISKKSGNWKRTLETVHNIWQVRRNAAEVMDKLKIKPESTKAILALAWRLKGSIMRYLGIATEKGTGIRNPIGIFFALTKRQPAAA